MADYIIGSKFMAKLEELEREEDRPLINGMRRRLDVDTFKMKKSVMDSVNKPTEVMPSISPSKQTLSIMINISLGGLNG
jgi:hypothetical protein